MFFPTSGVRDGLLCNPGNGRFLLMRCIFSTNGGKSPVWTVNDQVMQTLRAGANKALGREMPHWVIHDFRRTLRTHLARLGIPEVIGELMISHKLRGLTATYNIYDFETEKHSALEKWEVELTSGSTRAPNSRATSTPT